MNDFPPRSGEPVRPSLGALPERSGNVAVNEIRAAASGLMTPGWSLRETAYLGTNGPPGVSTNASGGSFRKALEVWLSGLVPSTRRRYFDKAAQLHATAARYGRTNSLSDFAIYLQERATQVSRSSRRQYRAAATAYLASKLLDAEDADERVDAIVAYLLVTARYTEPSIPNGTRLRSVKRFPVQDHNTILQHLKEKSVSSRSSLLAGMMIVQRITGCRPIETRTVTASDTDDGSGIVRIRNAKYDEDGLRACGRVRLHHYSAHDWKITARNLRVGITLINDAIRRLPDNEWGRERAAAQRLLRDTCRQLSLPAYRLYDQRHQFGADMKLLMDGETDKDIILAALMGHASSRTASQHYARKNAGRRRKVYPTADPDVIKLVRRAETHVNKFSLEPRSNV